MRAKQIRRKEIKCWRESREEWKHNIVQKRNERERKGKWDYTIEIEMTVSACYKLLHGSEPIITTENERTFWLNRAEQLTSSYSFAWNILLSLSLTHVFLGSTSVQIRHLRRHRQNRWLFSFSWHASSFSFAFDDCCPFSMRLLPSSSTRLSHFHSDSLCSR